MSKKYIDDLYAVMPPWGWDNDFTPSESLARTAEGAWEKFCHPAFNRSAYEGDGFKAVRVRIVKIRNQEASNE